MIAFAFGAGGCIKAPEKRSNLRTNTSSGAQDDGGDDATDTADTDGTAEGGDDDAGADGDDSLTYYNFAKALLDDHCVKCHGATPTAGAPTTFRLDSYDDVGGVEGVFSKLSRIVARSGDGTMPPVSVTGFGVPERQQLAAWFKAGGKKGKQPAEPLEPSAEFTAPTALHMTHTSNEFSVGIAFTDLSAGATWDLYYSSTSGAVSGGTLLIAGLPVATKGYDWLLMPLTDGEYFLYAKIHDGDDVFTVAAPGSVDWDSPFDSNAPPTITLTPNSPWTGNDVANRAVVLPAEITYVITDADVGDTHTVKIEYRVAAGAWQTLVAAHPHATEYTWDDTASPLAEGVEYEVKLTVSDGTTTDEDASSLPFGIADQAYDFSDTAPILAGCIGGGCHDPGAADWTDHAVVFPRVDTIMTRSADGTDMSLELAGAQSGTPLSDPDKLTFKLWRWQGAPEN